MAWMFGDDAGGKIDRGEAKVQTEGVRDKPDCRDDGQGFGADGRPQSPSRNLQSLVDARTLIRTFGTCRSGSGPRPARTPFPNSRVPTMTALLASTGMLITAVASMLDVASMAQVLDMAGETVQTLEDATGPIGWNFLRFLIARSEPTDVPRSQGVKKTLDRILESVNGVADEFEKTIEQAWGRTVD